MENDQRDEPDLSRQVSAHFDEAPKSEFSGQGLSVEKKGAPKSQQEGKSRHTPRGGLGGDRGGVTEDSSPVEKTVSLWVRSRRPRSIFCCQKVVKKNPKRGQTVPLTSV